MTGHAVGIQQDSAKLLMSGLQILEVRRRDLSAWEALVSGPKLATKADDSEYREVIRVMFGQFEIPKHGEGSLPRSVRSRSVLVMAFLLTDQSPEHQSIWDDQLISPITTLRKHSICTFPSIPYGEATGLWCLWRVPINKEHK